MPARSVPPGRSGRIDRPERHRRTPCPPAVVPTPAGELTASTAGEFAELLRLLQVRSGVTAGDIARRSGIARSQVYALIQHDRRVLPTQHQHVRLFAHACGLTATQVALVEALWVRLREASDRRQRAPTPFTPPFAESAAPDAPPSPLPGPLQDGASTKPAAQPPMRDRSVDRRLLAEMVEELKALRRGRGILEGRIDDRIGWTLRMACGVPTDSTPTDARRIVSSRLTELADQLPDDLRNAALGALALLPDTRQRFYQERVRWVAGLMERDERTAQRRINEGLTLLAELVMADVAPIGAVDDLIAKHQGPVWYTEKLRVAVVLDEPNPTAFEWRRIVSNQDGLAEIDLAFTLTAPPSLSAEPVDAAQLSIAMLYGGTLVARQRAAARRFSFSVKLAEPLARGERLEYAMRFQIPRGQPMQPHYVCLPRENCKLFELRVRFDPNNLPRRVWRLTKVFQSDLDDPDNAGQSLGVNAAGELQLRFVDLAPGFAYGARWDPPSLRDTAEVGGVQNH